jgi:hypothetical protein
MGNFKRANKTLVGKGTKAMYDILKSGESHNLSISCQLELFDSSIITSAVLHLYEEVSDPNHHKSYNLKLKI